MTHLLKSFFVLSTVAMCAQSQCVPSRNVCPVAMCAESVVAREETPTRAPRGGSLADSATVESSVSHTAAGMRIAVLLLITPGGHYARMGCQLAVTPLGIMGM